MNPRETLIGKSICIVDSSNKSLIGIEGRVADETKSTLKIINMDKKEKTIIKNQVTIKVGDAVIDCKKLAKRIEERIKK